MITSSISAPKDTSTASVAEHPNVTSKASYDESKDKPSQFGHFKEPQDLSYLYIIDSHWKYHKQM